MKKIDFENGTITDNILSASIPMLVAQLLNLLYNVVDRIYIARIPHIGTTAIGAVGICFPVIVIITAFANLFGSGGTPLFSIYRGRKKNKEAALIMDTSFSMLCAGAFILMSCGMLFSKPILMLFGASDSTIVYAYPYMMIYLIGTIPSNALTYARPYIVIYLLGTLPAMVSTGMNPFINAQGYSTTGMISVAIGAVLNFILDPLFIFVFGLGVKGAAVATVISQCFSAMFTIYFLTHKSELKMRFLKKNELAECAGYAKNIISLGTAGFIMQVTNSLVTICCNNVLAVTGGDIYISVMTIVSSVRQLVDTPIHAINEGSSPVISYNYGAGKPTRIRKAIAVLSIMTLAYTVVMWSIIIFAPGALISIFSSDSSLLSDAIVALKQYFAAFIFMDLQYIGQTVFKSLNKKKHAIFFSLLRKVIIVVPLTYIMPYTFNMGTAGVFLAEPVSNVIGGSICFITMLCTVLPELKRMAEV